MNPEYVVVCEVCGALIQRNKYERHIKYGHKEKRENKCHICQKQFTSLYNLQYHLAHHLNARNFLCNECPRAYNTSADLVQHQRIHEKQRDPYKCNECGLLFQIRSKYNTHMRIHQTTSSKEPKECQICKKKFVCLSSHNRIVHLGLRTYECSECGKTFGKKSGLDRHTLTVHQKIRGFKCEVEGCHGAFGEKSQLTKHMKTHSDRDLSYCSFCKQHFDDIKKHFDESHNDLTNHCKLCFKRFSKQSSLRLHIKVFHTLERNFFCDYCPNKGFAERFQLKRHLRRHQDVIDLELNRKTDEDEDDESCDSCSIEINPEQIFVDDMTELKIDTEVTLEPSDDVLVEIKCEIFSDDENISQEIKIEPAEHVKSELEVGDIGNICLVSEIDIKQIMGTYNDPGIKPLTLKEEKQSNCDFNENSDVCDENIDDEGADCDSQDCRLDSRFKCLECDKEFSKKDHLQAHFLANHTENLFSCNQCGRNFRYKSAFDRHIKIVHDQQQNHVCIKCGKAFSLKYDLTKHYETSHDESKRAQRTCHIYGKVFSKERNLQMHIVAIHNKKSFECEVCEKKFSFKSAKDRHVKVVHQNQRSHQCSFCNKLFGVKADLRNHIAFHHSTDPREMGKYYCHMCEKNFTSSSALARHHKGVHENIKQQRPRDYRCKFCKEVLANKYQKEKHLAQVHHDGLNPLRTCRLCNKDFQLFDEFKSHIDSHQNAFFCVICGVNHPDEETLKSHLDDHKHIDINLRRFTCDFCGHKLFNKIQLKVHMRKHMKEKNFYVCDVCGQSYKYISPFLYHKKVHEGKKDFVCSHCGKEFMRKPDLIVHYRTHTQEKPFKCTVCDKRFGAKQILYVHLQTHSSTRKVFKCDDCDLKFADKNQAKLHDDSAHPDRRPFFCNSCKKSFKHEHLLKIHKKHKHKSEAGRMTGMTSPRPSYQLSDFPVWNF